MNRSDVLARHRIAMGALWLLASTLALWGGPAQAACPGGDPCETLHVYRLQSRLPIDTDAAGRPILSLQEANATDAVAFRSILAASGSSTSYAIRYRVTRIADAPNNYCECNLELNGRGCPPTMAPGQLAQCTRVCRYNNGPCQATGFNIKHDGGTWYAFPAATQCGGVRTVWRKRTFGRSDPSWCDWREEERVIKSASCLADEIGRRPDAGLDALFDDPALCRP
ncbi:hypothetical protein [Marilutibacter chinensis]|uniref:CEL-III C-terminal domain-containing protein n=1 Tax=Marilutibacter chinensis TaxID=2912247 RepID=A0ABS9HXV0_9GAMM|nr:hypothetical protein [Lysobacter chinensis]MCF7223696.1 hypothetical protein [Lysobacter chinensis]